MESWKVVLADDEPIIRSGIRENVHWEKLQMKVVGEAEDGEEALEMALAQQAHLMLVDLNMPIMNGLTLMKHLQEQLPSCRLIIVTGHDEFHYAQEAIRLNVVDYILKPIHPEQLHKVLERVRVELELEKKKSLHLIRASEQIDRNLPLLRERFCMEWIQGYVSEEEVRDQLAFLRLPEQSPCMIGIIRWPELSVNQPYMKENDRQLLLFAIENMASELLHPYRKMMFRDAASLIVIMLWEPVGHSLLIDLEAAIQSYLKISVYLHFEPIDTGMHVSLVYQKCKAQVFAESMVSPLVRRARQIIQEEYADSQLTLDALAQKLNISPVYLSRLIKQELGSSFVQLISQFRIQRAIQLLNSTDLTISEIALRSGYDTQHYFSTVFKKATGVSPNQYRRGVAF